MPSYPSKINLIKSFFFFVLISLFACRSTNYLSSVQEDIQTIDTKLNLSEDTAIAAMIQPYKTMLDKEMNEPIGTCAVDLSKDRPESTLGNWMADAIHRKTEQHLKSPIDFAIQNYGGIRIPEIQKGPISRGKIYELMPFDNNIVVLALSAAEVTELLQHILASGGWPVSYALKVVQASDKTLEILINNQALESDKIYQVALPDYIANGGNDTSFLKDKPQQKINLLIRDALIEDVLDFTKKNQALQSQLEGRIIIK